MPQADSSVQSPAFAREFTTTHWSVVLAARETASPGAAAALAELGATSRYPLYAFVRRKGHSPHDAQDLTDVVFSGDARRVLTASLDKNED